MPRTHDDEIDRRILDATLLEIDRQGIVGLRVAEVAKRADTTVAMLYRTFGDREGLIAAALGSYYEDRWRTIIRVAGSLADSPGDLTIDDVIAAVPPLRSAGSVIDHQRMQRVYAAAADNLTLRRTVRRAAAQGLAEYERLVTVIADRLPVGQQFDPRILPVVLLRHNALFDDVLGPEGLTDAEFRDFLRAVLENSGRARARERQATD